MSLPPPGPTSPAGHVAPAAAASRAGGGALSALLERLRHHAWRSAAVMVVLCTLIAVVITSIEGRGFGIKLVYSFSIGISCLSFTYLVRLAGAALHDALRRRRGLPPEEGGFGSGWAGIVPGVLVAVLLGPPLGLTVADTLTGFDSPSLLDFGRTSTRMTLAMALVGSIAAVVVMSLQERLATARAAAEAAERQSTSARLALLQSQLEPHMLFNTLANLRVLIGLDPPRAQQMLDHLIAFLRTTLAASQVPMHPLAREFEWLDDYLALMRVRMGERLTVRLALPPELAALPVPPLLLQPLVENAVRHGIEPQVGAARIEVTARRAAGTLLLGVRDTGVGIGAAPVRPAGGGEAGGARGGFGLRQIRERLRTLYGAAASLTLEEAADAEGGTLATLRLPLAEAVPTSTPAPSLAPAGEPPP